MARFGALAAVVALGAAAACGGGDDGSAATATTPVLAEAVLPDTPVGNQVEWFLSASATGTIAPADYEAHFTQSFRDQVSLDALLAPLAAGPLELVRARVGQTPHYLTADVRQATQAFVLTAQVDPAAPGTPLQLLFLQPAGQAAPDSAAGPPRSWEEISTRVAALAPRTGMVVSRVGANGVCGSVFRLAPDEPQPLASVMKLYVLGGLASAVANGQAAWGEPVPLDPALVTVPTGILQTEPAGTQVAVRDMAALMISISDNTATDHLIARVGRATVEAQLSGFAMADPFANLPFLTVDESVVLQTVNYPALADQWRDADTPTRRSLLASPEFAAAQVPTDSLATWSEPRWDGVGWFGTPADICSALAGLYRMADEPLLGELDKVMTLNDGGLGLDKATWPTTWFKGGSLPGVFALSYLAERADGEIFVVALLLANETQPLDEAVVGPEALTLVRGAFALTAG